MSSNLTPQQQFVQTCPAAGLFIFPLGVKSKTPDGKLAPHGFECASNDAAQIQQWWTASPNANIGIDLGRSGLTVLDFDQGRPPEEIIPYLQNTYVVRTARGAHVYFAGTAKQGKMYFDGKHIGEVKSTGGYVLAPTSVHPGGAVYTVIGNSPIQPLPEDLLARLLTAPPSQPVTTPSGERRRIPRGQMHAEYMSHVGKLLQMGYAPEDAIDSTLKWARENLELGYDEKKVEKEVRDGAARYEQGQWNGLVLNQKPDAPDGEPIEVVEVFDPKTAQSWQATDMSRAVMNGRLGEICAERMLKYFPVAYAWPALIAVAGAMVPQIQQEGSFTQQSNMVNSYTALVGPVHSGKSQAIHWATRIIGLPETNYSDIKAGSSEALLKKLAKMRTTGKVNESLLIDLDEWSHFFSKAGIENSSFTSFLHTAFYKRRQNIVAGRGKELELDCALSFIGGIVEDEFDTCFGAASLGGLHDRFTFGMCPQGFNFMYRPFERGQEVFEPVPVQIAPEVYELVAAIRKDKPTIGREAEIAVRAAQACASFDGVRILDANYGERMIRTMITEQSKVREHLKPNAGVTVDAQVSNALVSWLLRNASDGKLVMERDVRHGLRKTLARFGPGTLGYTTTGLVRQGVIWYGPVPNLKPYKGRQPHAYRLMDASGFADAAY